MDKDRMNEIVEDYSLFNIPKDKVPDYRDPEQFSRTFKICSVLEYKTISYSDSTEAITPRFRK